jgi:hypothetical protein
VRVSTELLNRRNEICTHRHPFMARVLRTNPVIRKIPWKQVSANDPNSFITHVSATDPNTLIKHFVPTVDDKPTSPLQAYRSILRALSYFPDSHARGILCQGARELFEKQKVDSKARLKRRLAKAYSSAQRIERANSGNRDDFLAVLQYAYGQRGRRRRILVSDLLKPDEDDLPLDSSELAALLSGNLEPQRRDATAIAQPAKCKAFIESFRHEIPAELQRGKRRPPNPVLKIPNNIWGRTMPLKRQANITREWWALTLEKLYPPLPEHEWNRLRDLSTGKILIDEPIPKRQGFFSGDSKTSNEEKKLNRDTGLPNIKGVINHLLNPARTGGKLEFTEGQGLYVDISTEFDPKQPPRANYQRTIRRVYAAVWQLSAKMHRNLTSKEWIVEWGDKIQPSNYGNLPMATKKEADTLLQNGWKMPPDDYLPPGPNAHRKRKKTRDSKTEEKPAEVISNSE